MLWYVICVILYYYVYVLKNPMSNISYYIKKVYRKNNETIPAHIFLTKTKNDLMFFYTKVNSDNPLIDRSNRSITLMNNYIKAKKVKNAINRFAYLYKLKKAKRSVKYDLFFNDLTIIKDNQKIELFSNDTIYYFRLSDIISIWVGCLTKCENMFCSPIKMKNPYTNIEFSNHNLYNIYLSLLYSHFHIPKWITLFFEAEFDLERFAYDNYALLKNVAIDDFIVNGSTYEKFENILNMMHEYREYLNYIILRTPFTFREKSKIVIKLTPYLKNYLYGEYCCHPLEKKRCKNKAKRGLKRYFESNDDISYYRERPIRMSEWSAESSLSSRISRILTRSSGELNTPSIMPPPLSLSSIVEEQNSGISNRTSTPIVSSRNTNINNNTDNNTDNNTNNNTDNNTDNNVIRPLRIGERREARRRPISSVVPEVHTNTSNSNQPVLNSVNYRNGSLFNINLNSRRTSDPFTPSFTLNRTPNSRNTRNNNNNNFNMRMFN